MVSIWAKIKKHPVVSAVAALVAVFLALAGIWAAFSGVPMVPGLVSLVTGVDVRLLITLPLVVAEVLTFLVVLACAWFMVLILRGVRTPDQDVSPREANKLEDDNYALKQDNERLVKEKKGLVKELELRRGDVHELADERNTANAEANRLQADLSELKEDHKKEVATREQFQETAIVLRQSLDEALARIADLERALEARQPEIEALELDESEPSVHPLSVVSNPPMTFALRRIHIVNHGEDTILRNWEVWATLPGEDGLSSVDVMSAQEWKAMGEGHLPGINVPVKCKSDIVQAPRNAPIKIDIPFTVPGLRPDDVVGPGHTIEVRFTDGAGKTWSYGEGPLRRRLPTS